MGSRTVWVPVVSGPLAPYAAGFEAWLASRAYSASSAADRLYQFDQLSRWLGCEGLDAGELTVEHARRFAAGRRASGLRSWSSPQSAALPLEYLRQLGVAPMPAPVSPQGPLEELLADYCRYLSVERGLSDHTVFDAYGPAARLFLSGRENPDGLGLDRLSAAEVSSFLARECPKRSMSGARDLVCALRSLLRYLHLAGLTAVPLVHARAHTPYTTALGRTQAVDRGQPFGALDVLPAGNGRDLRGRQPRPPFRSISAVRGVLHLPGARVSRSLCSSPLAADGSTTYIRKLKPSGPAPGSTTFRSDAT